jgi:hypothetical protein
MMSDSTLGGYLEIHSRAPAFAAEDGRPYTVDIWVDEFPQDEGFFEAALLFVRWKADGSKPVGHLETPCLAHGRSPEEARAVLQAMTLHEVKQHLDRLIEVGGEFSSW